MNSTSSMGAGLRTLSVVAMALVSLAAYASLAVFSKDEQPLRKAVEDAAMCFHFAGEFNGDGSARDKEVTRMQRKVCKKDGQRLVMQAYRKNPNDARLYPAVLMLDGLTSAPPLSEPEKARLCAVARTELVCN
ncbi:hypothetical protein [Variovorax sp. E3]|uniref:hypothetical protein n=1 Tax=Variovorax sp. E3 TaxID=1914993 RepID=UPI0018DDDC03|nr:hypothetical protein [Variovorax sp. E3]